MGISKYLEERSQGQCELCSSIDTLQEYVVSDAPSSENDQIAICSTCIDSMDEPNEHHNHWRCLSNSMWSETAAVQVQCYRLLKAIDQDWARDQLDMLYLDDNNTKWAESGLVSTKVLHKDVNGNVLEPGDTVTLIQDLKVKGAGLTAKRGTAVRRISLVHDNADHIEGKVDGQHIVILTKYVKRSK